MPWRSMRPASGAPRRLSEESNRGWLGRRVMWVGLAIAPTEVDTHDRPKGRRRSLQAHRDLNARPHGDCLIEDDTEAQREKLEGFGLGIGLAGDVVLDLRAGANHAESRARN